MIPLLVYDGIWLVASKRFICQSLEVRKEGIQEGFGEEVECELCLKEGLDLDR